MSQIKKGAKLKKCLKINFFNIKERNPYKNQYESKTKTQKRKM